MPKSTEQTAKKDLIRVSELGEWVYCSVAWKLNAEGVGRDPQGIVELEAGREFHEEHGMLVGRTIAAGKLKPWLLAGILITACLLVLFLWLGR